MASEATQSFTQRITEARSDPDSLIRKLLDVLTDCGDYALEIAKFDNRGNPSLIHDIQIAVSEAEGYLSRART